jgi:RecG-like helicase
MQTRHALAAVAVALLISLAAAPAARAAGEKKPSAGAKAAASQPAPIDASNADAIKAAAGKKVVVIGTVEKASWARSGKVMRIVFKATGDATPFEAVVFEKNKEAVDKKFNGDAAAALTGAMVRVSGKISTYSPKNNPDEKHLQIVVDDVKQIDLEK